MPTTTIFSEVILFKLTLLIHVRIASATQFIGVVRNRFQRKLTIILFIHVDRLIKKWGINMPL